MPGRIDSIFVQSTIKMQVTPGDAKAHSNGHKGAVIMANSENIMLYRLGPIRIRLAVLFCQCGKVAPAYTEKWIVRDNFAGNLPLK